MIHATGRDDLRRGRPSPGCNTMSRISAAAPCAFALATFSESPRRCPALEMSRRYIQSWTVCIRPRRADARLHFDVHHATGEPGGRREFFRGRSGEHRGCRRRDADDIRRRRSCWEEDEIAIRPLRGARTPRREPRARSAGTTVSETQHRWHVAEVVPIEEGRRRTFAEGGDRQLSDVQQDRGVVRTGIVGPADDVQKRRRVGVERVLRDGRGRDAPRGAVEDHRGILHAEDVLLAEAREAHERVVPAVPSLSQAVDVRVMLHVRGHVGRREAPLARVPWAQEAVPRAPRAVGLALLGPTESMARLAAELALRGRKDGSQRRVGNGAPRLSADGTPRVAHRQVAAGAGRVALGAAQDARAFVAAHDAGRHVPQGRPQGRRETGGVAPPRRLDRRRRLGT